MGNWTGKVVSVLAVLFLLIYAGYQAYRYTYTPYRTETAYEYTVSDTFQSNGIIIRDEILVEGSGDGAVSYCVEEGEKVKQGTEIIRYYNNDRQARDAAHAEMIEQEIDLLKGVQAPGAYLFANNEALSGQIDEQIGKLVEVTATNSAVGIYNVRNSLLENICKRQLSIDQVENYNERITLLEAEKESFQNNAFESESLYSPARGYFSRYSDGCENVFSTKELFEMTSEELDAAINKDYPLSNNVPGKIMTDHNWYCAMVVDEQDGERFIPGRNVSVSFDSQGLDSIQMSVYSAEKQPDGKTIVILLGKEVVPGVLSARSVSVRVHFSTHKGLRVSDSAVRLVDGQIGVYVSTGYDLRFCPIEVLYHGEGYQICRENLTNENGLKMFDQVIVKGTDLYDGKPLL